MVALFFFAAASPASAQATNSPLGPWLQSDQSLSTLSVNIQGLPDPGDWQPFEQNTLSGLPVARQVCAREEISETVSPSDDLFQPTYPSERRSPGAWLQDWGDDFRAGLDKIVWDYQNFYSRPNLRKLALALAIAAPLANTDADDRFQRWYQRHVRSPRTDRWAKVGNMLGEHNLTVPVMVAAAAAGKLLEDHEAAQWAGDWGKRSIRALMVGSPTILVFQFGLGAGRPDEYDGSSHWRPFHDKNGVAGHGFVGAIPFLTAAGMTENRPLRALLFAGSFGTCCARINTDSHFLSQSILGWSIAYLAVQSVTQTESDYRRWQLVPLEMPQGGTGVGLMIRY